jgi:PRTRC genetic system protein B
MYVAISIGQSHHYELSDALLLYKSKENLYGRGPGFYITHHAIGVDSEARVPKLGPAKPLTLDFIESLVQSLGGYLDVEFLPENVIARTQRTLAWWTPSQTRRMYFADKEGELAAITGSTFPQPALVWMADGRELYVRALKENKRPTRVTKLCFAPYWNLNEAGNVCQGSMRSPKKSTVASMPKWEASFYESEFTTGTSGE